MRDFRISVGNSLKDKLAELGFFLQQIADISKLIENKYLTHNYPINIETDKLNYFFSAYLNAIQSLKDGVQTATGENFSWKRLSPTYGDFIFYCRNATTHDGYHLINFGKGTKNYITGPLRRIDGRGKVIEFDPPNQDIRTLCCDITEEILVSLRDFLNLEGQKIPFAEEVDFKKSIQESLNSDFIPQEIKDMIKANQSEIEASVKGIKVDVVQQTINAIVSVETIITNAHT
jgi:hypothetical protein